MKRTSENRKNGKDPRRRDVMAAGASGVHRDCDEPNGRTAVVLGRTPRSGRRWTQPEAKGSPTDQYGVYFDAVKEPYRIIAHLKSRAKVKAMIKLPDHDLIQRLRQLLSAEKEREASNTIADLDPCLGMIEWAQSSEADASLDEEKAAILYELASRGYTKLAVIHAMGGK